jgi:hypothetical protein
MLRALTQYPALDRLRALDKPTLVVAGSRDSLLPGPARIQEVAGRVQHHGIFVVIDGAAHAINFSHPGELANVIRLFMADKPIVDDPNSPGTARAYELHRGIHAPKPVADAESQPLPKSVHAGNLTPGAASSCGLRVTLRKQARLE